MRQKSGNKSHSSNYIEFKTRRDNLSKIEDNVEKLVTEPINKLGYEVYDVIYAKEGNMIAETDVKTIDGFNIGLVEKR